ncbi:hypothetical protein [Nocardia sp. NPDC058705]|uniref:hypothetical protein n=1 Tax=Nocardia sp. NPDC058705 TaxID=3346609 RepID=UPI0036A42F5A
MTVVDLRRAEPGLLVIAPSGAPLVTDAAPGLDVLVLEVVGGHLSWSLLDGAELPAAVIDDVEAAQDWVWAVYGEAIALAVAGNDPQSLTAVPARPELVTALRRLAYAHWAIRWWPASTIDGIPSLDARLLLDEIESLTGTCEMVLDEGIDDGESAFSDGAGLRRMGIEHGDYAAVDDDGIASGGREAGGIASGGRDASGSTSGSRDAGGAVSDGREHGGVAGRGGGVRGESRGQADDYALAAGGQDQGGGLIVARGSGGWDWRRCPPGVLDASEQAVSWQVTRSAGVSTAQVSVVAAPDCRRTVPEHLRPFARVRSVARRSAATEQSESPSADDERAASSVTGRGRPSAPDDRAVSPPSADVEIALQLRGDVWTGTGELPGTPETSLDVAVFVPGVGPADPADDEVAARDRIRRLARRRLTGGDARLTAETAAAEADEDF